MRKNLLKLLLTGFIATLAATANAQNNYVLNTYYPIYNYGGSQYVNPTSDMPFDKLTDVTLAFAHVYLDNNNLPYLSFEQGQESENLRTANLIDVARNKNPNIKVLISLGYTNSPLGLDWDNILKDAPNNYVNFANSVVSFLENNNLDGLDIDDESLPKYFSQSAFDSIIATIKSALVEAGTKNNKYYYLTISPAWGVANISKTNQVNFDWINMQNYGGTSLNNFSGWGIDSKLLQGFDIESGASGCTGVSSSGGGTVDENTKAGGMFTWTFTQDASCLDNFDATNKIYNLYNN